MDQAHILYSGIVQGVGFRFTVQRIAQNLDLTGWVRNLPSGSVEIMVNGSKGSIEQLCREVEKRFEGNIKNKEIQFQSPQKKYSEFEITF